MLSLATQMNHHSRKTVEKKHVSLRVIIFQDSDTGYWQAQCLEFDIATQARLLSELHDRLFVTVRAYIEEGLLFELPRAPQYFFAKWESRAANMEPQQSNHYPELDEVSLQQAISA